MGSVKYYEIVQNSQIFIFKEKQYLDPRSMCLELNSMDTLVTALQKENELLKKELEEFNSQKLLENKKENEESNDRRELQDKV